MPESHRYVAARSWQATEYVDHVSGAKGRRPALDALLADARRRSFDVLVVWRLDQPGRNLRHLVLLLDELTSLGVMFIALGEATIRVHPRVDCSFTFSRRSHNSSGTESENGFWQGSLVRRHRAVDWVALEPIRPRTGSLPSTVSAMRVPRACSACPYRP